MIRRMQRGSHFANIVVSSEPEEKNPWCSTCAALGKMSRLKQKIVLDSHGKLIHPQPPDCENWLMCWTCGLTIATYEAQMLGKISPITGVQPIRISCRQEDEDIRR